MKNLFFLLPLLMTIGCITPTQMKRDGIEHEIFKCYGWQKVNQCAPYSMGLSLRLMHHGIEHERVVYKTSVMNTEFPYHSVVLFNYKGTYYVMDNESYGPRKVYGNTKAEKLKSFSSGFRYILGEKELRESYDPFWDKKHYDGVMKSFDKYKKDSIISP